MDEQPLTIPLTLPIDGIVGGEGNDTPTPPPDPTQGVYTDDVYAPDVYV